MQPILRLHCSVDQPVFLDRIETPLPVGKNLYNPQRPAEPFKISNVIVSTVSLVDTDPSFAVQ